MRASSVAVAAVVFTVVLWAVPAFAHVPMLEGPVGLETASGEPGQAVTIGGPEKSRAIYGYLEDGETDSYAFETSKPVMRTVRVIVPDYPEHTDFMPTLSLEEDGILVATAQEDASREREAEFEPFSLTWFLQGAELQYEFEPGAEYVVSVGAGAGDTSGRYVLTVSGPEEFTGADITGTFRSLPRIWVGAYGGAPARWNPYALIPAGVVLLALGLLAFVIYQAVHSRRTSDV